MRKNLEPYSDRWCAKAISDDSVPGNVKQAIVQFGIATNNTDLIMKRWFGKAAVRDRETLEVSFTIALAGLGCTLEEVTEFANLGYIPHDNISTFVEIRSWEDPNG